MKWSRSLALALLGLASTHAYAIGTVAGTDIRNTAQVSYSIAGTSITTSSNTSSVIVAEILDTVVTSLTPGSTLVTPGGTQQEIALRVTNIGNGSEAFTLTLNSNVAGDDFDLTAAAPAIYFDTDGSGDLSAADIAYSPGNNDPVLAPDASVVVLIVHDIPNGLADGQAGRVTLTAAATTGTGAPGTVFAGAGTGGVDALAGTTGADGQAQGEYLIASIQLNAAKSSTVLDPFGGTRPVPGARINYRIDVNVSGSGTADSVVFSDAIPANTTYLANSLRLNSAALTDVADGDAGQFTTAPSNQVRVALGDLTSASGTQSIEFTVTIN